MLAILFILLLFSSAFFSGSEAALFSLPPTRLKVFQTDVDPRKRLIANLLLKPRDLLVTVFMLNTLANILLQNVAANFFGDYSSWLLTVGVPLFLTLIFAEVIPKYIGLQHNFILSYYLSPPITFLQDLLKPIRKITVSITDTLSRILFFYLKKEETISEEEIQHILQTSEQHGIFNKEEGELLTGYLDLQDSEVRELMRPKEEILFYDIQAPLSNLLHLLIDRECSRVPVCHKNLDHVLGIITAKNFFLNRDAIKTPADLSSFLSKPFYIPETLSARMLLRKLHEQSQVLALVIDEYGLVIGLITREDLFEVVIGDIKDLRDQTDLFTKAGKNELIASGKLPLEDFNELFDVELISPNNMITIGGWLTEKLGEIPLTGHQYEFESFLFKILSSSPSRIKRLYIRKLPRN